MPMHKVEVDDEVFAFVQKHAEPLVDNFNSALRRVLASGQTMISRTRRMSASGPLTASGAHGAPLGMPQALGQILDVVRQVLSGRNSRRGATQQVARRRDVALQTVIDKYTRQLGLTAAQFDRLLLPERREELRKLLHSKFPEHVYEVDQAVGAPVAGEETPHGEHLVDIAERMFGPGHGIELAIPHRGTAPQRPIPDVLQPEHRR